MVHVEPSLMPQDILSHGCHLGYAIWGTCHILSTGEHIWWSMGLPP